MLLWTVLPPRLRRSTRPVAAADYWLASPLRRFVGARVFRALLIDRPTAGAGASDGAGEGAGGVAGRLGGADPIDRMAEALDAGDSLILFPEGTRNVGDVPLLPFRSGLHRLALARPGVDLVPVWIAHLNRVLPKGEVVPVPLLCTVSFGAPLHLEPGEAKAAFLERAREALLALRGAAEGA